MIPVKSGTVDLCTEINKNDDEVMTNLLLVDLPTECPFPKVISSFSCFSNQLCIQVLILQGTRCTDGSQIIDISKYKKYLSLLAGREDISLNIVHDTV